MDRGLGVQSCYADTQLSCCLIFLRTFSDGKRIFSCAICNQLVVAANQIPRESL